MGITNAMDKLVAERQNKCDHNYQDRMVTPQGVFCGECGKEEK